MGKRISAAEMLSAGRQRPPTAAETGTEPLSDQTSKPLDDQTSDPLKDVTTSALSDQTSDPLNDVTTSAVNDQTSKRLDDETSEPLSDVTTSAANDQTTKPLDSLTVKQRETQHVEKRLSTNGQPPATYQRITVFLTPAQRQWLKLTARQLPDGLSGSDIVRLAMSRLAQEVTGGLDLVSNLTDQAHSDAEVFSGRRNRGLPPRADVDA